MCIYGALNKQKQEGNCTYHLARESRRHLPKNRQTERDKRDRETEDNKIIIIIIIVGERINKTINLNFSRIKKCKYIFTYASVLKIIHAGTNRSGRRRRGGGEEEEEEEEEERMEAPRSPDYAWAGAASSNLFFSEPGSRRSSAAHRTGAETTVPEGYSVYFSLLGVLAVVSGARQLAPLIKSFNKRRSRQECTGSSSRRICIFF